MLPIEFKAYGKVNLYLAVGEKRPDGFHDVETVMHRAPVFDTVRLETSERTGIHLTCSDGSLPVDGSNLLIKAVRALHDACGMPLDTLGHGYDITLDKRIPVAGGMGGGSADAGAVIRELNRALGSPLDTETLVDIAAQLGSDVPFFVYDCEAMLARGRGERLTPCPSLPPHRAEFASCGKKPSTAFVYSALDDLRASNSEKITAPPPLDAMLKALESGDLEMICRSTYNAFEDVFDLTDNSRTLASVKAEMYSKGAATAFLCGSGPTVCAIFEA